MESSKYLGACILAAAVMITLAISYTGMMKPRYQFHTTSDINSVLVLDTSDGAVQRRTVGQGAIR